MTLDFIYRMLEHFESLDLDFPVSVGILQTENSIALASLPGGTTKTTFMDGTEEKDLPFEVAIKVKEKQTAGINTLELLANDVENLKELKSDNGSYEFQSIRVTSAPFLEGQDVSGFFVYRFNIIASLTIFNKKEG